MSETDNPEQGTGNGEAMSLNDAALAIESLLGNDPEPDTVTEDKSQEAAQEQPEEGEDELVLTDDEAEEGDEPEETTEYKAGKFASDDAKVTLDDGTTISVAELKQGSLRQRDYTVKTQELAEQRKAFEATQRQFAEYADALAKQREVIERLSEKVVPQEPSREMLETDPIGYLHAKAEYDARMAEIQTLFQAKQAEEQQLTARQQAEMQQYLQREQTALLEVMPHLKDKARFEQFRGELLDVGTKAYGFTNDELASITDHRVIRALADAAAYRKALAKRDAGKKPAEPAKAPQPRIQQRQRMAPASETSQRIKQAEAAFSKSRSINDAAKLLENLL